jgi:hypothetical protein
MAQNREQRYATAADMRRAFQEAEQASTVVNRGEAQTVLFPTPPPKTVPIPTQTVASPRTVGPTGETTVVRPKSSSLGRWVPIAISAVVLVLIGGALAFYALRKHDQPVMQTTSESPTPIGGPAADTSPSPKVEPSLETNAQVTTPAAKKAEKTPRNEEAKKAPTPERRESPQADADAQGHEDVEPPDVPVPPDFQRQNRPRKPMVRVMPGGVTIRTLPDGTQIITTPDGGRFMIGKDGTRTVLSPPPPRRRPTPEP